MQENITMIYKIIDDIGNRTNLFVPLRNLFVFLVPFASKKFMVGNLVLFVLLEMLR